VLDLLEINNRNENQRYKYSSNIRNKKKLKGTKMTGNYSMLYSGICQEIRAQSDTAIKIDYKWTFELYFCQRSYNNCSPQNQQRTHNYNRSLCSGRRQGDRNDTFLQTTTKGSGQIQ
jgi:hypothetical protein